MPIVDVELVMPAGEDKGPDGLARRLADALAAVFAVPAAGRVWVRLSLRPSAHYAENGVAPADDALPAFVTVLHARPPEGDARATEAAAIAQAVAACVQRPAGRVHVEYAPAAHGRLAFGGTRWV